LNEVKNQNKTDFVNTINYNLKVAQSKFDFLKSKNQQIDKSPGEQNKKLSIKIEDNLQKIGLRLEHFIKSGRALDEDIEQSFLDTIKELEWRLKEFDLFVQNKDPKLRRVNK